MRKLLIKIFRNELQDNMKLDKMAPPKNAPKDAFIKKKNLNTQGGETWQVCWQKERHLKRKILKMVVEKRMQLKMVGGGGGGVQTAFVERNKLTLQTRKYFPKQEKEK